MRSALEIKKITTNNKKNGKNAAAAAVANTVIDSTRGIAFLNILSENHRRFIYLTFP